MSHLDTCGILTNDQHGFGKGLSTETQHLPAIHDWSHTLYIYVCVCVYTQRRQTEILLLHFSKAFGSVPHRRLLEKLRYYWISCKTNKVIEGLLRNRGQRVVVNGSSSHWASVTPGVPRGTVISQSCSWFISMTSRQGYLNEIVSQWQCHLPHL